MGVFMHGTVCPWVYYIALPLSSTQTHTQTWRRTHPTTDASSVGMGVCEGNMVPPISITGSQAGVSPHTKDAERLAALAPDRGREWKGKKTLLSFTSPCHDSDNNTVHC